MLYLCYLCQFKPLRDHLRGFLIAAWAGDKIAEFSFPEISFYFPLRPWFFFVSPAYAGKSATSRPAAISRLGSPPRMRGKVAVYHQRGCWVWITPAYAGKASGAMSGSDMDRITPACAGKSWNLEQVVYGPGDHPRVCGEKSELSRYYLSYQGSPPRMRGKANSQPIGS